MAKAEKCTESTYCIPLWWMFFHEHPVSIAGFNVASIRRGLWLRVSGSFLFCGVRTRDARCSHKLHCIAFRFYVFTWVSAFSAGINAASETWWLRDSQGLRELLCSVPYRAKEGRLGPGCSSPDPGWGSDCIWVTDRCWSGVRYYPSQWLCNHSDCILTPTLALNKFTGKRPCSFNFSIIPVESDSQNKQM